MSTDFDLTHDSCPYACDERTERMAEDWIYYDYEWVKQRVTVPLIEALGLNPDVLLSPISWNDIN